MEAPSVKVPDRDGPVGVVNTPRGTSTSVRRPLIAGYPRRVNQPGHHSCHRVGEDMAPTRFPQASPSVEACGRSGRGYRPPSMGRLTPRSA